MSNHRSDTTLNGSKLKRRRTRFLKRYVVSSDEHSFVGRLYGLGIVSLNFDSYESMCQYPDIKYAVDSGYWADNLVSRVESLNLAGDLLWPEPMPSSFKSMPVSRYQWLTIAADVFLVRYVSVIDCALLLVNQVFQLGFSPRSCTAQKILKAPIPDDLRVLIQSMFDEQELIRTERNARVHHGLEREFTDDDTTFRTASLFTDKGSGMVGTDRYGRKVNVDLSFREGLAGMQRDFNHHVVRLEGHLERLYDLLWEAFEDRFGPLVAKATHGMNANAKHRRSSAT